MNLSGSIPLASSPCAPSAAVGFAANTGTCALCILSWEVELTCPKELEGPGSSMPFPQILPFLAKDRCGSTEPQLPKVDKGSP